MPQSTPTATPTRAVNEIDITEKAEDKAKAANLVLKAPDSRLPSLFRKVFSKNKLHPHQSGGSFTAKKLQFDYTAPPHQQDDKDAAERKPPRWRKLRVSPNPNEAHRVEYSRLGDSQEK